METSQGLLIVLQAATLGVLVAISLALVKALQVHRSLRGGTGSSLMAVNVVVLAACFISQLIFVINVFGLVTNVTTDHDDFRRILFLSGELVLIVASVWAFRRLNRI